MSAKTKTERSARSLPIVVIGGGPAGMTAARTASKNRRRVILYDKNPVPGKKLGSISSFPIFVSEKMPPAEAAQAFGEKQSFVLPAIKSYGWERIRDYLHDLGFTVRLNGDRRLQISPPETSSFSSRLSDAAVEAGVIVKKSCRVSDLKISKGRVTSVVVNGIDHPVSAVILASGSYSAPKLGSTRDGYVMAEKAGHKIVPIEPAMVGFETVEGYRKILGDVFVRDCSMEVFLDDELQFSDRGDMAFSEHGVEGELIFNHAAEIKELSGKGTVRIHIDMIPDKSRVELEKILGMHLESKDRTTVWEILTRYVPDKMLDVMHTMIRVHCRKPAVTLSNLERKLLAIWLKDFNFTVRRQRPFNHTKGVFGGVSTDEIDPNTLRSTKVRNLYFAGEVMDLQAPWGGFNIQMAFATGYLAGLSAAKEDGTPRTAKKAPRKAAG